MNLVVPGSGLVFALLGAPWWVFPLALIPYALMVFFSVRDPKFIARALGNATATPSLAAVGSRAVTNRDLLAILERVADSESRLVDQVNEASPSLKPLLATSLEQVRSAAKLGHELARKIEDIDSSLARTDVAHARAEAGKRREWARKATDDAGRQEFLDAATALDESAAHAESLRALRQKTFAQLDHLAVSLENALVRSVRIRVASNDDEGARAVSEALRIDVDNLRETLAVFEEPALNARRAKGS